MSQQTRLPAAYASAASLFVLVAWPTIGSAQQPLVAGGEVGGAAGERIELPVSFTPGETAVSSIRFELTLPSGLAYVSTAAGSATTAADKSATAVATEDGVRVLVFGLNANALGQGPLALVSVDIAEDAAPGALTIGTRVVDASSPDAQLVVTNATDGTVTVEGTGPECGDGNIEGDETCDPPSSCPTSCDDEDLCTEDQLSGRAADCDAVCTYTPITSCNSDDGCCPDDCDWTNDDDCEAPAPDAGASTDGGATADASVAADAAPSADAASSPDAGVSADASSDVATTADAGPATDSVAAALDSGSAVTPRDASPATLDARLAADAAPPSRGGASAGERSADESDQSLEGSGCSTSTTGASGKMLTLLLLVFGLIRSSRAAKASRSPACSRPTGAYRDA
jgi:hypothetical protein